MKYKVEIQNYEIKSQLWDKVTIDKSLELWYTKS